MSRGSLGPGGVLGAKLLWGGILLFSLFLGVALGSTGVLFFHTLHPGILQWIRLPRVLIAGVIGGMLGLSGAILQLVLRNPLADGFTTGIASSSALGMVLALLLGVPLTLTPVFGIGGGVLGLLLVLFLASGGKSSLPLSPVVAILAGVVVNTISSAGITFAKYRSQEQAIDIVFWLMGHIPTLEYRVVALYAALLGLVFCLFSLRSESLNLLALDDISAATSGVPLLLLRRGSYGGTAFLITLAVSRSGLIGFVGLIVPHIARSLYGSDTRTSLYFSTIMGAILLVNADTLARVILPGGEELPVGVITALLGGGFFIYLLIKRKDTIWHVGC